MGNAERIQLFFFFFLVMHESRFVRGTPRSNDLVSYISLVGSRLNTKCTTPSLGHEDLVVGMVQGSLLAWQYLLCKAEFIAWCLRSPFMGNAEGTKHFS